ncbi:MAG: hypothetical protein ACK5IP_20495 [Paracoccus sp. (in: a-proteobacteria)]
MIFRVADCQDSPVVSLHCRARFWQSTALIGATLLFCLAGVRAEARTLYYNYDNTGGPPNPATGGVWVHGGSDENWVQLDIFGNFEDDNTTFLNSSVGFSDDVHFLTTGDTPIAIEIEGELTPDEIVIEDGSFVFNDDGGAAGSISGGSLTIAANSGAGTYGMLESNVDLTVSGTVTVAGELVIGGNATLAATSGGSVAGQLLIGSNATLTAGGDFQVSGALVIDGSAGFSGSSDILVTGGSLSVSGTAAFASGSNVQIAGGSLSVDGIAEFAGTSNVQITGGSMSVNGTATFVGESGVGVVDGSLSVDGTLAGHVLLDETSTLTLGSDSYINGNLTFDGTTFSGAGHVGRLRVLSGADVTFVGANAVVDQTVNNSGSLTLGAGSYSGNLVNNGSLVLVDDVFFEDSDPDSLINGQNGTGATILASGGDRVLSFVTDFENDGWLRGGGAGNSLTIEAESLTLNQNTLISGRVILSGAISNSANLDLAYVPVLQGTFTNTDVGIATVTADVDGNGQDFTNEGTLAVTGGDLTGLNSLVNSATLTVAAGQTLGAATIIHSEGTLTSEGMLEGAITSSSTAAIRGAINGSLDVVDDDTTITGALDMSGSADGGAITVGEDGHLVVAENTTVITGLMRNDGWVDLGTADSGTADVVIDGDVINAGRLTGEGRITGDLTFTGGFASRFTGTLLTVDGALINDLDGAAQLSDFDPITYGSLENLADLTIDRAVATDVTNRAGGTLNVDAAITGALTSYGQTYLDSDVIGQLQVMGGQTLIGVNAAGGPVTVGGSAGQQLLVGSGGSLVVAPGDLISTGNVRANGEIRVLQSRTLTTPQLIVASGSEVNNLIRGTVVGGVSVRDTGVLALDGATITGGVVNDGTLEGVADPGLTVNLQGGLTNNGQVSLLSDSAPAVITGSLTNNGGATAVIDGDVIAGNGLAGDVTNVGDLQLTGDVAGLVNNGGLLVLDGDMARLENNLNGDATVTGNVGTAGVLASFDATNRGTLALTGDIANSLRNFGTASVTGAIGGNAENTGELNLAGSVGQEIRNTGSGATLNITGGTQATELVNTGTVNIVAGRRLLLTSGQLTNLSGGTLNVFGTLGAPLGSSALLDMHNNAGATLVVAGGGTLEGNLTNAGDASIAGAVTGGVTNSGDVDIAGSVSGNVINRGDAAVSGRLAGDLINGAAGDLELQNGARVDGTLTNRGDASVVSGAEVTVSGLTSNEADLTVRGQLTSDVVNTADGRLEIIGGSIVGDVRNDVGGDILSAGTIVGDVTNDGTFTVDLSARVEGDFTNEGLLTQSQDGSFLTVTDTFTNNGTIDATNGWTFNIRTEDYENNGRLIGDVRIDGDIGNTGEIIYTSDTPLTDDLDNRDGGLVRVLATLTGNGTNTITNRGIFDVADGGALLAVDTITNYDRFQIASGSRVEANRIINAAGTLTNGGVIEADLTNRGGAELVSTGTIAGNLTNAGSAELQGALDGALSTLANGETTVTGDLAVTGPVRNDGSLLVAAGATLDSAQTIVNDSDAGDGQIATLTAHGAITGNVLNNGTALILGGLDGNLTNAGDARLSGEITGALVNDGPDASSIIRIRDSLRVGAVDNSSGMLLVGENRSLTVDGQFQNSGDGMLRIAGEVTLASDGVLLNSSTRGMRMLAGSTLNGDLRNEDGAVANLAGTIDGGVLNRGEAHAEGRITGNLINEGARFDTTGDLEVEGWVINRRAPASGVTPPADGPQAGPGDPGLLVVAASTSMTTPIGVQNDRYSTVQVDGTLNGDLINRGRFHLTNQLNGSLLHTGTAELAGEITGDLTYRRGTIELTDDLTVGGIFEAFQDFTVDRGRTLTAGLYHNLADRTLTVNGTLAGAIRNAGTIDAGNGAVLENLFNTGTVSVDRSLEVRDSLRNDGLMEMRDGTVGDVLAINGGVSGNGTYGLDLDLGANGGAGAADTIVVRGGAVTGSIVLSFDASDIEAPSDESRRILVFDADDRQGAANDFSVTATGLPETSERIVYTLDQNEATGDVFVEDGINPTLGALAGNLALTQSLIGSVVNRPTSPFVPGLATDAGDKKCGYGAWARAVAGHAKANGRTRNGEASADSKIEANYRGLQFGGDLACFENSVHGWNVAFGVLGGVNDGSTTQPVYLNNTINSTGAPSFLSSVNHGDFRQIYGGVYATATRDRLSLDLQLRREHTEFTIRNRPTGDNVGLQLQDPDFDSNATTLSGSISYAYDLPWDGWMVVPTAGFAFSNLSVDKITFTTGDTLQIEDSKNRVGFVGGTLSKTFIRPERNSAIYAFGTATVYKDFASDTNSIYQMVAQNGDVFRTDELTSSNLGTYGELSLGANYLKVLDTGRAGAPRQFNASIRVDGRTGDVLDSYGVTAQVRFQF